MQYLVMLCLLIIMPLRQAWAEPQLPPKVVSLIKQTYSPKATADMVGEADLNGDGIADWAMRVSYPSADGDKERVVAVFGHADGSYTIAGASEETVEPMRGELIGDIKLKRGSIFLTSVDNTCCEDEVDIEQFKYRHGGFYRIGIKASLDCHADDDSDCGEDYILRKVIDTNLLTGDTIVSYFYENKKSVKPRVPTKPLLKLEQWPSWR